jgi:protein SCO1/2
MRRAWLTACLLLAAWSGAAEQYDRDSALAISQGAIGVELGEHTLRDGDGQTFVLSQLRGKPLVISMVYTSCHHVCPTITRTLGDTVEVARDALGNDAFSVVSIGFDWKVDTPERMRQFAMQHDVDDLPGWYFLASDPATVEALAKDLGFIFYASAKGFDHLAQTTIVDREGVIYRQVYGARIETQALVEPLKELVFDTRSGESVVTHWMNTLKLFCTVYDPNSGRYRFDYSIFVAIVIGALCLGAVATFVIREWKHAR